MTSSNLLKSAGDAAAGLSALIAPLSPDEFLTGYWTTRHVVVDRSAALAGFARKLADLPVRDLLRLVDGSVLVMLKTGNGQFRGANVPASECLPFYESGMALYFNVVPAFSDTRQWTERLALDVGQSPGRCRASLFITPPGWRTETHFDPNENFTVQLRGHKIWRVAPNACVEAPIDRYTVSGDMSERMNLYCAAKPEPPRRLRDEHLGPGSMIYLPRGFWHEVDSVDEAVALNYCIMPETWASFLAGVLDRLFATSPELRQVASRLTGPEALRDSARQGLRRAISTASELLENLQIDQLAPPSGTQDGFALTHGGRLWRNRLATVSFKTVADEGGSLGGDLATVTAGGFTSALPAFGNAESRQRVQSIPVRTATIRLTETRRQALQWMAERESFGSAEIAAEPAMGSIITEDRQFLTDLITASYLFVGR